MDLRQLRCFAAIGDERSCGRAARRLHISQPAVSMMLQKLEKELGVQLLARSRRGSLLTDDGRVLHQRVKRILVEVDALGAASGIGRPAARLCVGYTGFGAGAPLFTRSLDLFRAAHPGIELKLIEVISADQPVGALRRGEIDAVFMYCCPNDIGELRRIRLRRERLMLAVPAGHRLAGHQVIDLAQLRRDGFVFLQRERAPEYHASLLEACRRAGFSPRILEEGSSSKRLLGLVASGKAVAFIGADGNVPHSDCVLFKPILGDPLWIDFELVWRPGRASASLLALIETVEHIAKETSRGTGHPEHGFFDLAA